MASGEAILIGIGAVGGLSGFAALVDVLLRRGKTKAEERKLGIEGDVSLSDQALKMYQLAREEAQEAKIGAEYCRQRLDALEEHVDTLKVVMRAHQLDPPPFQFPAFVQWKDSFA